jgi:hypothetical protein
MSQARSASPACPDNGTPVSDTPTISRKEGIRSVNAQGLKLTLDGAGFLTVLMLFFRPARQCPRPLLQPQRLAGPPWRAEVTGLPETRWHSAWRPRCMPSRRWIPLRRRRRTGRQRQPRATAGCARSTPAGTATAPRGRHDPSATARRAKGCHPPGDPALNRARSPSRARYARSSRRFWTQLPQMSRADFYPDEPISARSAAVLRKLFG